MQEDQNKINFNACVNAVTLSFLSVKQFLETEYKLVHYEWRFKF